MVERSPGIPNAGRLRTSVIGLVAVLALAIAVGLDADNSSAAGISAFSMSVNNTQAGGHPDWSMDITFEDRSAGAGVCACEDVEKVDISAPTGLIGNPHAVPRCTLLQYGRHRCPPETQVGIVNPKLGGLPLQIPMYNMEPHPDQAGLVAFETPLINTPVFIDLNARTDGDYGLDSSSGGIFHLLPIHGLEVHLWGVPGSPEHDVSRWPNPQEGLICIDKPYPEPCGAPVEFNAPIEPLLQNPTNCGDPLVGGLTLTYYDFSVFHADAPMDATTGCDQLSFDPSITVKPTTTQADTAAGVDIDLVVPQTQNPTTPTPSQIRSTTVTLPEGMSVNPNAADGKTVCTDEQGAFGTRNPAQCPESSKIGTVTIDSSALPGPIGGAIYLGESKPGDKYRIFLTGDGYSTHVKLAGSVRMDPATGRVVTEFNNLPQSPLSEFNMHFFGAERGLLATPDRCGTYSVTSEFVPWDSALADHTSLSFFTIDSGPGGSLCPVATRPFTPSFRAGMEDNTAGAHSSFGLKVGRADGDQNLSGLKVLTPPGFTATLAGLSYCPDSTLAKISSPGYSGVSEQTAPACPANSRVGTVATEVGAGSRPLHVPGTIYYAGPYKGAPLSLVTVIPAVSGPYDLGNVVVRTAVTADPSTAQVTTTADRLPQIIDGIPLRVRGIQVDLDRPGFALNPTNCAPKSIDASVLGDRRRGRQPLEPLPGRELRRPALRPKAQPSTQRGRQEARASRRQGDLHREAGRSEHRRCDGCPTGGRAPRQRSYRQRLHPRPVRRGCLPGFLGPRDRGGLDADPGFAVEGQRLPAFLLA